MKRHNTQSIGDVIRSFMKESNLESKIMEQKLYRIWPLVLGEQMASYCSNLYVRNQTLFVTVSSSTLRNELMMCRARLIANLNQQLGAVLINNIIFR